MDWHMAIERNGEALKRILAMLVAMAGLADRSRTHLPRRLHRACLRLLRPAESAVRRLIVVAARGITVTLPPIRLRASAPRKHSAFVRNGRGTGIVMPHAGRLGGRLVPGATDRKPLTRLALPLFDTLPGIAPRRPRTVPPHQAPRIRSFHSAIPGFAAPAARPSVMRRAPRPDDPIEAVRLRLRLEALGRTLDDLPAQALRFARWRARSAPGVGAPRYVMRNDRLVDGSAPGRDERTSRECVSVPPRRARRQVSALSLPPTPHASRPLFPLRAP